MDAGGTPATSDSERVGRANGDGAERGESGEGE